MILAELLEIPDGGLAADHFITPTFGVTINKSANAAKNPGVRPLVVRDVRAFLRSCPPWGQHSGKV